MVVIQDIENPRAHLPASGFFDIIEGGREGRKEAMEGKWGERRVDC
jgi:hypothetical protein